LENVVSFAQEGEIAKLRSVVRLVDQGKYKEVVRNNFTSLIALREWTHDAQKFVKNYDNRMEIEDEGQIYTTLYQLATLRLCIIFFIQLKLKIASTSLRWKWLQSQQQISQLPLSSTTKRTTNLMTNPIRAQCQSIASTLSVSMKAWQKETNLLKFGYSLMME
jgi:hypothetical protein